MLPSAMELTVGGFFPWRLQGPKGLARGSTHGLGDASVPHDLPSDPGANPGDSSPGGRTRCFSDSVEQSLWDWGRCDKAGFAWGAVSPQAWETLFPASSAPETVKLIKAVEPQD